MSVNLSYYQTPDPVANIIRRGDRGNKEGMLHIIMNGIDIQISRRLQQAKAAFYFASP